MKIQKFEYLENKKSFLDEIKRIFHSFWRAIICWKIKFWWKIVDTSFKGLDIFLNIFFKSPVIFFKRYFLKVLYIHNEPWMSGSWICRKIQSNFCHTSLWYKVFMLLINPFWGTTRNCKYKTTLTFFKDSRS